MTKYPDFDKDTTRADKPGEHCLYMSSKWNEEFVAKHFTDNKACKGLGAVLRETLYKRPSMAMSRRIESGARLCVLEACSSDRSNRVWGGTDWRV